jgi:hypothetical protein
MKHSNLPGSLQTPLSPEAESFYRSQYQRYLKAIEITPESAQVNLRTAKAILRYNANAKDAFDPQFHQVSYVISDGQLRLLERGFEEVTRNGDVVTFRGRFRNLPEEDPIQQDGSAKVQTQARDSIALIPKSGNTIRTQDESEEELDPLAKGIPVAYECNCGDYSGKQSLLKITAFGEINRRWSFLGSLGGCKHILSSRLIQKDLPAVPRDLPMGIREDRNPRHTEPLKPKGLQGNSGIRNPKTAKWR